MEKLDYSVSDTKEKNPIGYVKYHISNECIEYNSEKELLENYKDEIDCTGPNGASVKVYYTNDKQRHGLRFAIKEFDYGEYGLDFTKEEYEKELNFNNREESDKMSEDNQLYVKLETKLEQELNEFKQELMKMSPAEIIMNSYKLVCMQGISEYFSDKYFDKSEIKILLNTDGLLEECYERWKKRDGSLSEVLEYSTDEAIKKIINRAEKKHEDRDAR